MWNLKCTNIPVIIGVTGIVTRSLRKNLEEVSGKHSIDSLQKTAVLGTSHTIRKVLQCEAWSLSGGDHHSTIAAGVRVLRVNRGCRIKFRLQILKENQNVNKNILRWYEFNRTMQIYYVCVCEHVSVWDVYSLSALIRCCTKAVPDTQKSSELMYIFNL